MTGPVEVLVVGSGAGGATTALELARRGLEVVILEEGGRVAEARYGGSSPRAMQELYRRRGMTPIQGSVPIGFVEGCCVGGSTEINSGFWHRTSPETLLRWKAQFDLAEADNDQLTPHFEWAETLLGVGRFGRPWPPSTELFYRGIEAMGWSGQEVPRTAPGCANTNTCAMGCPSGAKQGMSRSLLPAAEAGGVRIVPRCRVKQILRRGRRALGVLCEIRGQGKTVRLVRIDAEHLFVCAGPTETPSLLQRSGLRHHVGDTLRIHPMLKVVARFREEVNAQESVLPLLEVREFWPELFIGGAFFSLGHLAMALSDNWPENRQHMTDFRHLASYYVAVRATGRGSVRPARIGEGTVLRYRVSDQDLWNLSRGLARLSSLLLAAGAMEVYPCVQGLPIIRSDVEAIRWLDERLDRSRLSLTTVHAFSSCPMGERRDRCALDSFGRVFGFENLYVNDASMLPDSPGINPQGSVMGFARRNAIHFAESR